MKNSKTRPRFVAVSGRSRADDGELVRAVVAREPGAWEALWDAVGALVHHRVARRIHRGRRTDQDREEMLADVTAHLLAKLHTYNHRRANLTTWVVAVVDRYMSRRYVASLALHRGGPGYGPPSVYKSPGLHPARTRGVALTIHAGEAGRIALERERVAHTPEFIAQDEREHTRRRVREALAAFTDRDRRMVLMRLEGMTLRDIGNHFAISRERVRQICDDAIASLRAELRRVA